MLGKRDNFSGNILLYDYLAKKRAPVFLDRNLTVAFQRTSHFRDTRFDFRPRWQPPSQDLLNKMIDRTTRQENLAGNLIFEIHSIKSQANSSHDDGPVRKVRTLLRVASTIRVSILGPNTHLPCVGPLVREAVLKSGKRSCREVSIDTSVVHISSNDLAANLTQIASNDSYKMVLTMEFTSRADAKELHNYLGLETSDTFTHLSTSYDNILECPQGRKILPLTAYGKPLSIGLEVSMYWNGMPRESVLARCNRRMKPTIQPPSLNPPSQRYNLRFIYGNETLERSELICLHCSKRKTTDIYELQMHLISWHEYFNYKVTQERVDENGVEHWRFHSEVADHRADQRQRTSNHADEPYDVRILAPAQQFDIMRFLKGDDGFQRAARVEKATSTKPIPPPINKARKTPKEVQSRPLRKKKKYTIPKPPPGVTFFRSISKRPLQPGEEVSESDDEFDEEWMFQRKHAEHKKDDLSESTIRFLKLFDGFMREENLQSIFHMGDAIIRFARQHGSQIGQKNDTIMNEFTQKLKELLEDDLITKEVHTAALEIVAAAQKKPDTDANQPSQ